MSALGPLLFVLLFAALATAGFTGIGVQDTRDTRYTLVGPRTTRQSERRPLSERLRNPRPRRQHKLTLPTFHGRHLTH